MTSNRRSASWRLLLGSLVALLVSSALVVPSAQAAGPRGPGEPDPVDALAISELPVRGMWGVSDEDPAALHNFENYVWDFTQIGDRMYVAGSFRRVQGSKNGTTYAQPYLMALDLYTGAWIPEFSPNLNGPVFALEVSPIGTLLAGGQFTAVDGQPNTSGLVGLDPTTGRIDTRFRASVQRPWATEPAVVRSLEVVGNQLYLGGNFSHVRGNSDTQRVRVNKLARVDSRWGTPDGTWRPQIAGSGVYGFGIDTGRGRMHVGGFFSSVNGAANTASFATIDLTTGALVPGLQPFGENISLAKPRKVWDVEFAGDKVFTAGEEHAVQVLRGSDRLRLGHHFTGLKSTSFTNYTGYFAGGDFQVIEQLGDWVFAGCHCTYEYRNFNGFAGNTWYDSFANQRKPIKLMGAISAATGRVADWSPDLAGSREGIWAVHSDSLGCVWLGGQFDVAGVEAGSAFWVGNLARFCPPGAPVGNDTVSPTAPTGLTATVEGDNVRLNWNPGTDDRAVAGYVINRDGVDLPLVTATSYLDIAPGDGWHTYRVKTVDRAGNRSGNSNTVSVQVNPPDLGPPTTPTGLTASVDGSTVTLTWQPSTDDIGVTGYAVYRNGAYLAWAWTPTYTHTGVANGTWNYTVRAFDAAGNRSALTPPVAAAVGPADLGPPTAPTGLTATVAGADVTLTWQPSTDDIGVTGYAVYRNGAYLAWAWTPTYTHTGVANGTWNYTVRAFDAAGNRSDRSNVAAVTVP